MASFTLREAAKTDLKRIAVFTERRWGREQRNRYLRQLDAVFHKLAQNPETGVQCDYILSGYRKYPILSHVIYYRIGGEDTIEIIRILHKSMDVNRAFPDV
jgi:toxin ParE1/3/4